MATRTDDEIDTAIEKLEQILFDETFASPLLYTSLKALIEARARTDEREKVFKKLGAMAGQIELDKLKKFAKEVPKAKSQLSALLIARKYNILAFNIKEYEKIVYDNKVDLNANKEKIK